LKSRRIQVNLIIRHPQVSWPVAVGTSQPSEAHRSAAAVRTELPIVLRTKVASGRKCVVDRLGMTFGCHWLHSVQPRRHASTSFSALIGKRLTEPSFRTDSFSTMTMKNPIS